MARKKRQLLAKKRAKIQERKARKQQVKITTLRQPQKPQLSEIALKRQQELRTKMFEAAQNIGKQLSTLDLETRRFLQETINIGVSYPEVDYNDANSFNNALEKVVAQTKPDYLEKKLYEAKTFLANVAVGRLEDQDNPVVAELQAEVFDLIVDATPEKLRRLNTAYSQKDLADFYEETDARSSFYEEEEMIARLEDIKRFLA